MMANDNETVREVCAEMRGMGNYQSFSGDHAHELANRIESSHEREMAAKDAEIARLKAALKPVMECNAELDIEMACCFDDDCINGDVCVEYKGERCWVKFIHAVREAQRIMHEGDAAHNRVAKKCREGK